MNYLDMRRELELIDTRAKLKYQLMGPPAMNRPAPDKRSRLIATASLSVMFLAAMLFLPGESPIPGVQGSWAAALVYYAVAACIAIAIRVLIKRLEQAKTMPLSSAE